MWSFSSCCTALQVSLNSCYEGPANMTTGSSEDSACETRAIYALEVGNWRCSYDRSELEVTESDMIAGGLETMIRAVQYQGSG
ncbi:hypothetical protein GY45DRAFT_553359 [Cubamyces sp. BRFM 1775]|nr:hypothetical protein GY45DRAFT_553359 [Cubamyces sp. BRFM 1775]